MIIPEGSGTVYRCVVAVTVGYDGAGPIKEIRALEHHDVSRPIRYLPSGIRRCKRCYALVLPWGTE